MFALEIDFADEASRSEALFVRRPEAIIGASADATVVIEDMNSLNYQIALTRTLGRSFNVHPVSPSGAVVSGTPLEGRYEGEAKFELGNIRLHITALDCDLLLREGEPPDRAGVRVLRQSVTGESPVFPAVLVRGTPPAIVSFVPDQPVYIGRGLECTVRLNEPDISNRHARLGYESGSFWIEDLGSTNGTFVEDQQISGRINVKSGVPIVLGKSTTLQGVNSDSDVKFAAQISSGDIQRPVEAQNSYPAVVSLSEVARPARLVLPLDGTIEVGRDPRNDIWLGAPHVSRRHCSVVTSKTGAIHINDHSTNGTLYDEGMLGAGERIDLDAMPRVFDFGSGITLAICFSEEEEMAFTEAGGSIDTFTRGITGFTSVVRADQDEDYTLATHIGSSLTMWQKIRLMFTSLSFPGQVLLITTVIAFLVIVVLVANMLAHVIV